MMFLGLKNKLFGWEYAYFVWKSHCSSGKREIKRIKTPDGYYVGQSYSLVPKSTRTLEPRGRFNYESCDYMQGWEPITDGLRSFYESEPPQVTTTPQNRFEGSLENLSLANIDYIMGRYGLQRIENEKSEPKSTLQEYTGKRLIQL